MKPPTLRELLSAQITRCCDLLGHHPESDKIDKVLKRAYDAQRSNDWTLIWAVNKELSEFK